MLTCGLCGTKVHKSGVRSHRRSPLCKLRRRAFELEKRGLVQADSPSVPAPKLLSEVCTRLGIEHEVAPSAYRGIDGIGGVAFYSTFAPAWVAAVCRLRAVSLFGDDRQRRLLRICEAVKENPELRDAILAAEQVSTEMVLTLLTQQGII